MSKSTKVLEGQSFLDKVIESTGSITNSFDMLLLNEGVSISDDLSTGQDLSVSKITNELVVNHLSEKKPATSINNSISQEPELSGIDYMAIGIDFIIE